MHEEQKCSNFDSSCKFCVGGRGRIRFHRQQGFKFVSLDQGAEQQCHSDLRRIGCRPLRHGESDQHTMHEADIDFTTITRNLIECMTMIDRGSSHGFSFTVPNRTTTQHADKRLHLELKRIGRMTRLKLKSDGAKAINNIVECWKIKE